MISFEANKTYDFKFNSNNFITSCLWWVIVVGRRVVWCMSMYTDETGYSYVPEFVNFTIYHFSQSSNFESYFRIKWKHIFGGQSGLQMQNCLEDWLKGPLGMNLLKNISISAKKVNLLKKYLRRTKKVDFHKNILDGPWAL